jgi:hypothetical protein
MYGSKHEESRMRLQLIVIAAAAALAACDRPQDKSPASPGASPGPSSGTTAPAPQANTPTTPANIGQPKSQEEKKEGANPVQGQVDPKFSEQHRDFKQKGDAAGPTSPETKPKSGG